MLHFDDRRGPVDGYRQAERLLLPHQPRYSKAADRFDFGLYRESWPQAVDRAQKLAKPGEEHKENPSTGMWRLVRQIVPAHQQR
ncbi:hypothetical protein [Streptomyces sp. NPDC058867]|uniref:hypothetical protein n=1 Tax=unclassified Streptomyces TaxID=2593676 RepID=UPI0036CA0726